MLWQRKFHKHLFIYLAHNKCSVKKFLFYIIPVTLFLPLGSATIPLSLWHDDLFSVTSRALPSTSKPLGSVSIFEIFPACSLKRQQQPPLLKLGRLSMEFSWSSERCYCLPMFPYQLVSPWSWTWGNSIPWTNSLWISL